MPSRLTTRSILLGVDDALPIWRQIIFKRLFSVLALLCIPVYLTSVYLCILQNLWQMALFDTVAYAILVFILFSPRLSDTQKFTVGCCLTYFIGIGFLWTIGPTGAGFFWLFVFPPLSCILMGEKMALWAQVVNGVSLLLMGIAFHFQLILWPNIIGFSTLIWFVIVINFLVTNAIVTQSMAFLLGKLSHSLASTLASRKATVMGLAKLAEYRDNETGAH